MAFNYGQLATIVESLQSRLTTALGTDAQVNTLTLSNETRDLPADANRHVISVFLPASRYTRRNLWTHTITVVLQYRLQALRPGSSLGDWLDTEGRVIALLEGDLAPGGVVVRDIGVARRDEGQTATSTITVTLDEET